MRGWIEDGLVKAIAVSVHNDFAEGLCGWLDHNAISAGAKWREGERFDRTDGCIAEYWGGDA